MGPGLLGDERKCISCQRLGQQLTMMMGSFEIKFNISEFFGVCLILEEEHGAG